MANIQLRSVRFSYPLFHLAGRSLKVSTMKRLRGNAGLVVVPAIREVSFTISDGERVGLIGRNGSGKSTMLRMLAGLAVPEAGDLRIEGRVVPLIEKGLGIHPEFSGMANIELPLRLLGASSEEVREAERWIPEFTGLGPFMQLPVRTYSEGMRARLAFAISTAIRGDILLLDEWLSAGDLGFVEKAEQHLISVLDKARILVLASHSNELIRHVCTRVIWLEQGRVIEDGPTDEVLDAYIARTHQGQG